jgi:membrane-associated phospholipid phosphatase
MRLGAAFSGMLAVVLWSGSSFAGEIPPRAIPPAWPVDGSPYAPRPIPFLSGAAASTATNPALGVTYGSSMLRQVVGSAAVIGLGFLLNSTVEPGGDVDGVVDKVGGTLGSPYVLVGGTGVMALYGWKGDHQEALDTSKDLALALGASYATVSLLKLTVSEERPDMQNDHSFPSGHAAGAFAVATVLDRRYGGVTGWVAYGTATFIAASRVIGDHHWLQDVVAGAVIGHFYGWLFTR